MMAMLLGVLVGVPVGSNAASAQVIESIDAPDPKPEPKPEEGDDAEPDDSKKSDKTEAGKKEDESADEEEDEEEDADRYLAITGAVIHTVTAGDSFGKTILTKNGKIDQIGYDLDIPEEAERLDATGFHVYPGLVAVGSRGLLASPPEDDTNVYALNMTLALAAGVTTAVNGNSVGKMTYGSVDDIIVRRELFTSLKYSSRQPTARRKLREAFEKVRQYQRDLEAYEEEKKTDEDAEEPDNKWISGQYKTCLQLMKHEVTATFDANDDYDIVACCQLAERYNFKAVIKGATEGWTVASQMARAGVSAIVTPRTTVARDSRSNRPNGSSIENAAILHRHGIPLAIVPRTTSITLWGVAGTDLLHLAMEAAFAVRGGLPQDAAIRAITIDAARLLGIDHRVGSIEVGKDADFVITDGDLLHYMTLARWTIVNGRIVYDKDADSLFEHIRKGGDRDAPPPDDYWPHRLGAGQ